MMFKRILLPLDGSHHAECAIPIALRLASANAGTLILLRVVNPNWFSATKTSFAQELPAQARFEAEKYLLTLTKRTTFQGIQTEIRAPIGNEAPTILATAEQQRADIIVINSHGYTGLSRWTMGSVAEKVTRYAKVPVLLLRHQNATPLGLQPDPTQALRVLVPLDGSNHATTALEPAVELIYALATPANSAIHLVRVISDTDTLSATQLYLQTIATRLKQGDIAPIIARQQIPVTWSIVVSRDAADALIRVAENGEGAENGNTIGCDMIALSAHGSTGYPLWTLGSTAERVRVGTRLPLLIIRPPAMSRQQQPHDQYEPEIAVSETQNTGTLGTL